MLIMTLNDGEHDDEDDGEHEDDAYEDGGDDQIDVVVDDVHHCANFWQQRQLLL